MAKEKTLNFIYQDQLSFSLPIFSELFSKKGVYVFIESRREMTYVKHHKQKLVLWLSCMRTFAKECLEKGLKVLYYDLHHPYASSSLAEALKAIKNEQQVQEIVCVHPSEYRQKQELSSLSVSFLEDNRFFCSTEEFKKWAQNKKQIIMEFFYREMRKKTNYLMDQGIPEGGAWNYDSSNRKPLKGGETFTGPKRFKINPETQKCIEEVNAHFPEHFGSTDAFFYATTREQAKEALEHFVLFSLAQFGDYQDAMKTSEPFLYHSLLSQYINIGLLTAQEVCDRIVEAYHSQQAPLNAVEGYLRQILGWREFVRGIYWLKMPHYQDLNYLEAQNPLPSFYWTGETKMNCLKHCVQQTLKYGQSHHIQRLMITGNFALLIGAHPKEVCDWYLIVYLDAYDWVELPNTLGMALFADHSLMGTKPYSASGNYINKMSNFCSSCHYKVKEKTGPKACPFNYLYWDFLIRNQEKLRDNKRLSFAYSTLDRKSEDEKKKIRLSAKQFLYEVLDNGSS